MCRFQHQYQLSSSQIRLVFLYLFILSQVITNKAVNNTWIFPPPSFTVRHKVKHGDLLLHFQGQRATMNNVYILRNVNPSTGVRNYYYKLPLPSWILNLLSPHWKCDLSLWQTPKRFTKAPFSLGREARGFPQLAASTCVLIAGQKPELPLQPLTVSSKGSSTAKRCHCVEDRKQRMMHFWWPFSLWLSRPMTQGFCCPTQYCSRAPELRSQYHQKDGFYL